MVLILNGWARFRVDGRDTVAAAGDCLHHRPGTVRTLRDHSADLEYLEVVGPPERQTGHAAS
jgi:mannose-6-phosphate isomerase-like protein (cupin superfamily)